MLIITAVNQSGLAPVSNYSFDVYINRTRIAGGVVTGHKREEGWRALLRLIVDAGITMGRTRPHNCECDNTHEQNGTCCQPCWEEGFRSVPGVKSES